MLTEMIINQNDYRCAAKAGDDNASSIKFTYGGEELKIE